MKRSFRKLPKFSLPKKIKKACNAFLWAFLFFGYPSHSFGYLAFDPACVLAYQKIWNLELPESRRLIQQEKKVNPANSLVHLLDNSYEYLRLFISADKDQYEPFKKNCSFRLALLEKESAIHSPLFLFCRSQIHLQSAIIRANYQDYFSAAFEMRKAYLDLQKNQTLYPAFPLNTFYLGLIETMLGNIPANVRFVLIPLGLKGSLETGFRKMEQAMGSVRKTSQAYYAPEMALYYAFLVATVAPEGRTLEQLQAILAQVPDQSLLKTYVSGIVSVKKLANEEAIRTLRSRPQGAQYSEFYVLDYQLGVALLNRLDTEAIPILEQYVKKQKSSSFKEDARLRIAWAYCVAGRNDQAGLRMLSAQNPKFELTTERDRQAFKEARKGLPGRELLKARLLFDGGYLPGSLSQLLQIDTAGLVTAVDKLEYTYRLGRVYEAQGNHLQAIKFLQLTLQKGQELPFYFAANATLHLGLMAEKQHNASLARKYFEKCLAMNEKEYKSSIDQEAQNALSRIKKR